MPVRPGCRRLALASEGSESKLLFHQRNKEVVPAGAHIPYRAISRICRLGWLGKCDSDQARAQQEKTCNGHSEETVRGEFFTHDTPPIARECWLPSRPIARLTQRGRLLGCTVKEISARSENLNLTDALEQQRPQSSGRGEVRLKAFSFWERHGTNSTWDRWLCHGKRGG